MMDEAVLVFRDANQRCLTKARIVTTRQSKNSLDILSESDALEFGEQQIQLLEGESYQYEVLDPDWVIEEIPNVCSKFRVGADDRDRGTITPGLNTGILRLYIAKGGVTNGSAAVEVRSRKIDYRTDYRQMLLDISEKSIELLLAIGSPSGSFLEIDESLGTSEIQQRFYFIRALLMSEEFDAAMEQVFRQPHSKLVPFDDHEDIRHARRGSSSAARQIASSNPRTAVPSSHPLSTRFATIPKRLESSRYVESLDTPENRFIKFVLEEISSLIDTIELILREKGQTARDFARRELISPRTKIQKYLSHGMFSEISNGGIANVGSPVLQKKPGYREFLRSWIQMNAASALSWEGSNNVFEAGRRDIATLYEYWILFVFIEAISCTFGIAIEKLSKSLIKRRDSGLGLMIKSGELLEFPGLEFIHCGKPFRIQVSYNKSFSTQSPALEKRRLEYNASDLNAGSWTRRMRPDITLAIWPSQNTYEEAASLSSLKLLHFDSKYSVEKLAELFGSEDQKEQSVSFQRTDLLKMHVYKDAIRKTEGAYIVYPGTNSGLGRTYSLWQQFHEIIPGLGAFVVRPQTSETDLRTIRSFLLDVMDTLV